jgi:divalent metal cation (Fe/Co/Zn/Cd) transporter
MTTTAILAPPDRARLGRRAQLLAAASITYNIAEAVVAVIAGLTAGSVALIGFGLDSVVEVSSGLVIVWQFRHRIPESRERLALRLIGATFFALAAYVTVGSVRSLIGTGDPAPSRLGIALAAVSLLIMPLLSWAQRRTGRALGSASVVADSTQTLLCTYLSAVLLAGLLLNSVLGWGWADPIAGLIIAAVAVKEGVAACRGDACCAPIVAGAIAGATAGATHAADECCDECSRPSVGTER